MARTLYPDRGLHEKQFTQQGFTVIGIDEVGKGCIAGPVYAAAVQLDYTVLKTWRKKHRDLLRDSKTLSAKQRQEVLARLDARVATIAVGFAGVDEVELYGINPATFLAMRRALRQLPPAEKVCLLIDGKLKIPQLSQPQLPLIKGDYRVFAIAAASIAAKEARDAFMRAQHKLYPLYDFAANVGYGTKRHLQALDRHGRCPLHRRNFAPIKKGILSPAEEAPLVSPERVPAF